MSKPKTIKRAMQSKAAVMRKAMRDADEALINYQALVMLRNRITEGVLTDELYKFLNVKGSLESILVDLPLPSRVPTSATESLQTAQLAYVDTAIEGVVSSVRDMILKLIEKFGEWVKDWVITNNRLHFRLQRNVTRLENYITDYGDPITFDKMIGVCFTHDEWKIMCAAAKNISTLMSNVPSTNPAKYLVAHQREYATNLSEFGYSMTSHSIERQDPKYLKRSMPIGRSGAKWFRDSLVGDCRAAMDVLKKEVETSKTINNINVALKQAASTATDPNDLEAMKWLIGICRAAEMCASTVARGVLDICAIARRGT